jgi:hypothetical protein
MTPKSAADANPDLVVGDWIVRFEPRSMDDIRAVVRPDPENERRFAAVQRVSEINLGLYRSLLQPLVQASINEQTSELIKKLNPSELPLRTLLGPKSSDAASRPARRAGSPEPPARVSRQSAA